MGTMRRLPLVIPVLLVAGGCVRLHAAEPIPSSPPLAARGLAPVETKERSSDRCGIDLFRLLGDELALRPEAGSADLYRLLHEAVLGPGEALDGVATIRDRLAVALDAAGSPRPGEAIVEDLDDRQGTVRLNLRRWRFIRATVDELLPIVLASARAFAEGDHERLAACLDHAGPVLETLGVDAAGFQSFAADRAAEGFPPVPHGAAYREAHDPSYVVVLRRSLPPWVTAPPPEAG